MITHIGRLRDAVKYNTPFLYNGHTYDVSDRVARNIAVNELLTTLSYNEHQLDALTTLLLYEEITNTHPDKTTNTEYPFMSETQLARRFAGVHRKKDFKGLRETSMMSAENIGTDGVDYSYPVRKIREEKEYAFMNETMRSRNKVRRDNYNAFIKGNGDGVFTVNIETGVKTRHTADNFGAVYGS